MKILINCSNLKKGGGLQVGDSICRLLGEYKEHKFVIVLSSYMENSAAALRSFKNVVVVRYDKHDDWKGWLLGRDKTLDTIERNYKVDVALTVFGPSRWKARVPHLCGFARAQLILPHSPYFRKISKIELCKHKLRNFVLKRLFDRDSSALWTENSMVSEKLRLLLPHKQVFTLTNCYNQIFDRPDLQRSYSLQPFDGTTLLCVNAPYNHKNLDIAIASAQVLVKSYPDFSFRFVMTVECKDLSPIPAELKACFVFLGRTDICYLPSLYKQSDICFQPTLLECFTATYPEAMRVGVPIVTTDLDFAHGLCGEAAQYYSPLNADACATAIYKVATNAELRERLVAEGRKRLKLFDDYKIRAKKIITICENMKSV